MLDEYKVVGSREVGLVFWIFAFAEAVPGAAFSGFWLGCQGFGFLDLGGGIRGVLS